VLTADVVWMWISDLVLPDWRLSCQWRRTATRFCSSDEYTRTVPKLQPCIRISPKMAESITCLRSCSHMLLQRRVLPTGVFVLDFVARCDVTTSPAASCTMWCNVFLHAVNFATQKNVCKTLLSMLNPTRWGPKYSLPLLWFSETYNYKQGVLICKCW
jgi:hypothetical protein